MRSWRADSLCLRMARSRNYPMLQKALIEQGIGAFMFGMLDYRAHKLFWLSCSETPC
jgi:hypothetical protein